MNIAFWDNQLCERGTTVSLFDYAYYNQTILNNKSFIFYDKNRKENNKNIIEKFKKHFTVHETDNFKEVDEYLIQYKITHIYIIKYGHIDDRLSKVAKNCIHCVFDCGQPHGDVYSSISPWVNGNNGKYPVVPHMINLPNHDNNMRELLNIPKNAIVFGGYGGSDSFSIIFVHGVVYEIAKNNPNIYFLFANFNKFCPDLPNIIHLPMITDLNEKVKFINTTDAMLWARQDGETFGISIGEFSTKNKPVIASKVGDLSHFHLLGEKAFWYNYPNDLYNILLNFNPEVERTKNWNAYENYTPEKVMEIFKKVYLE
jgi:hypothetical protein